METQIDASKKHSKSAKKQQLSSPKVILHYFDCYGRAESIRILLHLQGIEFEDRRYDYHSWEE
jgi:hypothetical protein